MVQKEIVSFESELFASSSDESMELPCSLVVGGITNEDTDEIPPPRIDNVIIN